MCPVSSDVPFSRWSKEEVCDWLQEQGLGLYVAPCQSWVTSGQTLLQASQHELEKVSGAPVREPRVPSSADWTSRLLRLSQTLT